MPVQLAALLAIMLTFLATLYLCLAVLPTHKNGHLPRFAQRLHDFFLFKKLYLEVILRFLYLVSTCFCVFFGFLLIFSRNSYYSYSFFFNEMHYESTALRGLFLLLIGPILLRIAYELAMLLILAVKNLMEINHKLDSEAKSINLPTSLNETPVEPRYYYCTQCGTRYDVNAGKCPNCGLE